MPLDRKPAPNDLRAFWMPFTANRQFKQAPRMLVSARDMHYTAADGRRVLDGTAGLWCCNAGHCRPRITQAVGEMVGTLDYAPAFQMGHPTAFELANRIVDIAPDGLEHVFYTNSGSEAVDTALKIALAYHRARGEGSRTRLIGRERGYHGVGFGGISVGGIVNNRRVFGTMLAGVDHLPHTHLPANAFAKGQPEHGAHLADELERLVALHGDTIAAVMVEPMAGSTGVLVPPVGYLKRLREICDKHGILLIFDEVITGFGRMGTPFAADFYGVVPDMLNFAKCVTNGVFPLGGVICRDKLYDAMMKTDAPEHAVEFFHGYTYSGHPVGCAAAIATLDLFEEEQLFQRAGEMGPVLGDAFHGALTGLPNVIGIRSLGLAAAVELAPIAGAPGKRAYDIFVDCFHKGALVRPAGDVIVIAPPYIVEKSHIDTLVNTLADAIKKAA